MKRLCVVFAGIAMLLNSCSETLPPFPEVGEAYAITKGPQDHLLANYFGILKSDLIEEVKEDGYSPSEPQLTEGEKMLLDLFNRVPEDKQQIVLQMIRAALGTQE